MGTWEPRCGECGNTRHRSVEVCAGCGAAWEPGDPARTSDREDDVEAEWMSGVPLQSPDDRYRTLFHKAGLHDPAGLRELAEMHRERVRQGRVPPALRGVV